MLVELARALLAALAVGLLPGWFWAAALAPRSDRAERLAYSAGLSMALVPAAALVPASLFGLGVTLPVAVFSALFVLACGVAAYAWLGPAKGSDDPILVPPAPPGPPALALLIGALALALGAVLGGLPVAWAAAPAAALVLSAGIAHLVGSRRGIAPRVRRPGGPGGSGKPAVVLAARYGSLPAVLLLVLARAYVGPVRHDWPYPRGVDRYEHAVMTKLMISEGTTESFMLYPPGLHAMTAVVSRLSGLGPLEVFAVLAPVLLVLPALSLYALGKRLWGRPYGVAAALFSGLVLVGPYQHLSEARYPNLIAAHFLLVLAIGALIGTYRSPSVRGGMLLALLGSSVVLYHQVASLYEALLLAVVGALFLPYLLARDRRRGVTLLLSLTLLGCLSVLYAWDTYDLAQTVGGLVGASGAGEGGEAVAMAIGTKPPPGLDSLLETLSQPVLWLGFLGALLLLAGRRSEADTPADAPADALSRATVLVWVLFLFVGSRTSLSGFPDRFGRDLGVPLALLAAPAFVAILRSLGARARPGVASLAPLALLLAGALIGSQIAKNFEEADGPSERLRDRPPPPEVAAAGEWLREHNTGGNILATPYVNHVPSRGMLAMGGYFGVQSYTGERIRRDRDIPPSGAGPLRGALWALKHPEGGRTRRFIEEHDVRYVVLYKRYITIDWRTFAARPDLYRRAFENRDVVVFAPRE